jgi:hypothetical protein
MKKLITTALILANMLLFAQETKPTQTAKDTVISGKQVKLYTGAKGGKYTIVTAKDGHQYKKYLTKK